MLIKFNQINPKNVAKQRAKENSPKLNKFKKIIKTIEKNAKNTQLIRFFLNFFANFLKNKILMMLKIIEKTIPKNIKIKKQFI